MPETERGLTALGLRQTSCGCTFGLVGAPALAGILSTVEERTLQYEAGALRFCDCDMGQRAQRFYAARSGNPYGQKLAEEAGRRRVAYLEKIDGLKEHERTVYLSGYGVSPPNRQAFQAVSAGVNSGTGLITLWGDVGVGKTILMIAAVNECRRRDWTAMYRTTADMLAWLRAGFDQSQRDNEDFSYEKRWQLLTRVRCLALDEMTAFSVTPWAAERFERLIDERWRSQGELLTICAFNAAKETEFGQTGMPDVIESRLRDRRAQWINIGGRDMRQVRN